MLAVPLRVFGIQLIFFERNVATNRWARLVTRGAEIILGKSNERLRAEYSR